MAFFFSAVYSESLYLALSVGVFWCARQGRWPAVGVLAAFAGATRSAGVVLLLPALILYLYGPREDRTAEISALAPVWRPRYRLRKDFLWLGLAPAGLALYMAYLALAGGDWLMPFHAQDVWSRHFAGPYLGVWDGIKAAFAGAEQLLSFQRHHIYFPSAGGSPFIDAGRNLMLLAFLLAAVPAVVGVLRTLPTRVWRLRAGCAGDAALLPGDATAADVVAALSGGAVPAGHLVGALAERPSSSALAGAGGVGPARGVLRRPVRHLALGGVGLMEELPPGQGSSAPDTRPSSATMPGAPGAEPPPGDRPGDARRSPDTDWPWWTAPLALFGGVALAAIAGLLVDIPAAVLGVDVTSSHLPGGLVIADTVVQDAAFVAAAIFCAQLGGRTVSAAQFGLRPPAAGWGRADCRSSLLLAAFLLFSVDLGQSPSMPKRRSCSNSWGPAKTPACCSLSAALTCVIAPICEEFLFRGYIFTALRNWRGTLPAAVITGALFGGVHAGSAPAVDLVPLAGLGFGLCLLYRYTGSLYPCIVAHSLNNSLAFGSLEEWELADRRSDDLGARVDRTARAGVERAGVISAEPAAASPRTGVGGGG